MSIAHAEPEGLLNPSLGMTLVQVKNKLSWDDPGWPMYHKNGSLYLCSVSLLRWRLITTLGIGIKLGQSECPKFQSLEQVLNRGRKGRLLLALRTPTERLHSGMTGRLI